MHRHDGYLWGMAPKDYFSSLSEALQALDTVVEGNR